MNRKSIIINVNNFEYSDFFDKFIDLDLVLGNRYCMSVFVVPINEDINILPLSKVKILKTYFVWTEVEPNQKILSNHLFDILKDSVYYSLDKCVVKKDGLVCYNSLYVYID